MFKWLRNPEDARVGADGSVDWRAAKPAVSDDEPAAALAAVALAFGGECVGLTVADGDVAWAAARGAASTVVVTETDPAADTTATALLLAAAVRRIADADVVAIGDTPWDRTAPIELAAALGWPALAGVESAELAGERVHARRKVGDIMQVVDVATPVVLLVTATRAEQQAPGMKEILAARKKPVERVTAAELAVSPPASLTLLSTRLPEVAQARVFDGADPDTAAAQLVAALRSEGVL